MEQITKTVQASRLGGKTVAAVIRDSQPRVITYHGRPEALLIKLPDGEQEVEEMLQTMRILLIAGAILRE